MPKGYKRISGKDLILRVEAERAIPENIAIKRVDSEYFLDKGLYESFTALELIMSHSKKFGRLEIFEVKDEEIVNTDVSKISRNTIKNMVLESLGIKHESLEVAVEIYQSDSISGSQLEFLGTVDLQGIRKDFKVQVFVSDLR